MHGIMAITAPASRNRLSPSVPRVAADDEITLRLDLTPRWTHPDRRVDAVRGCVAIERGPLVYCFEQADQPAGVPVEDLAVRPGTVLGERPVILPGIGQTIEVTAD